MTVNQKFWDVYNYALGILDGALDALISKPYKWPAWIRHAYVLTLPISAPLRWVIVVAILALCLIVAWGILAYFYVLALWRGEEFEI